MSLRTEKINALIKSRVSEIILKDLSLKSGMFITISKVDTSPDLRYATISISVYPEKETGYAIKTLEREKKSLQKILNKKLFMKILPKISFKIDNAEIKTDQIEKLLRAIKKAKPNEKV